MKYGVGFSSNTMSTRKTYSQNGGNSINESTTVFNNYYRIDLALDPQCKYKHIKKNKYHKK